MNEKGEATEREIREAFRSWREATSQADPTKFGVPVGGAPLSSLLLDAFMAGWEAAWTAARTQALEEALLYLRISTHLSVEDVTEFEEHFALGARP